VASIYSGAQSWRGCYRSTPCGARSSVHCPGRGRPRTRPDRVLADKAYASKANRANLRLRGTRATIPIKADYAAHRHNRGSKGGRPPAFDPDI